ncbi:hypothetical protein ACFQV2_37140 [Actinokineospora soli]|uniref:Uncharacterized protein n=1 Tax=Actinokineospora soli TaxID=1048753 RepID=A0ABW2TXG7_9PSEU
MATVVDDAHLLDDLSATVVHQLVVRKRATVVITLRTGEPAPDAITALWKDEHLTRVELGALSEVDTRKLVETVLGGPLDTSAAARLWALTGGNALFLRHIVDGEREAGRLRAVEGSGPGRATPRSPANSPRSSAGAWASCPNPSATSSTSSPSASR